MIIKLRKKPAGKEKKETVQSGASGCRIPPLPSFETYSSANIQYDSPSKGGLHAADGAEALDSQSLYSIIKVLL